VPLSIPDPLNPRYSYGGGKIICELMAINYGRQDFDRVLIFRPHNVYGPDMGWEHVLPQFALRLKRLCGEVPQGVIPFPIQGTGQETRSFIHIDDFAAALMLVLEKGAHLNIYHIGTDEERSVVEAANCVAEYFGRAIRVDPGAISAGSTLRRCPAIEKLRALGFEPQRTFRDGVFDLVRWYDSHASLAPTDS
jgi:nucleoside-diphosphate-sugar epimerase